MDTIIVEVVDVVNVTNLQIDVQNVTHCEKS